MPWLQQTQTCLWKIIESFLISIPPTQSVGRILIFLVRVCVVCQFSASQKWSVGCVWVGASHRFSPFFCNIVLQDRIPSKNFFRYNIMKTTFVTWNGYEFEAQIPTPQYSTVQYSNYCERRSFEGCDWLCSYIKSSPCCYDTIHIRILC